MRRARRRPPAGIAWVRCGCVAADVVVLVVTSRSSAEITGRSVISCHLRCGGCARPASHAMTPDTAELAILENSGELAAPLGAPAEGLERAGYPGRWLAR